MREARRLRGARALLFERLVDMDHRSRGEQDPARVLDPQELRVSVRRELERLLNTRCALAAEVLETRERTTLEYGLPDFGHLQTRDTGAHKLIAEEVRRAVAAYEPRLKQVTVAVERSAGPDEERRLTVRVDAMIVVGDVMEPVSFVGLGVGGR
ncbi:type VI secretion system baseplate subunit TssE [Longimicrobium sp.]|uniref:type VI secretion system baseplate subunit TssE n=1 Tax=Longimicrobium sp. TaxID=2029185 RepID=UPI002BE47276|nr:type VI secretion system baseplate subunit TssE [Longimicrobium sp.]HSU13842.1 type VI secretion system baseplate subunit TssE [Longimicrobium sp.]